MYGARGIGGLPTPQSSGKLAGWRSRSRGLLCDFAYVVAGKAKHRVHCPRLAVEWRRALVPSVVVLCSGRRHRDGQVSIGLDMPIYILSMGALSLCAEFLTVLLGSFAWNGGTGVLRALRDSVLSLCPGGHRHLIAIRALKASTFLDIPIQQPAPVNGDSESTSRLPSCCSYCLLVLLGRSCLEGLLGRLGTADCFFVCSY